jgi:hypothetical protein
MSNITGQKPVTVAPRAALHLAGEPSQLFGAETPPKLPHRSRLAGLRNETRVGGFKFGDRAGASAPLSYGAIQARAVRRCGELLKQFDGKGRNQHTEDSRAAPTTQRQVAKAAGLSKDQQVTAVRVANVPQDRFDAVNCSSSCRRQKALQSAGLG